MLIPLEGEFEQGEKLTYQMNQPDGKQTKVTAKVIKRVNEKVLNQYGGIPGILTFNHKWLLEPVDGKTRVIQHEEYRGVWVWFWDYSWVEPAYQKANEALRDRVNKGMHRIGGTTFFVSQGAGTYGPRIRLGSSNEINLIRLIPET